MRYRACNISKFHQRKNNLMSFFFTSFLNYNDPVINFTENADIFRYSQSK